MRILAAAALAITLTLAGCGREQVTVKLTVTARGKEGGPVPGANVTVGGRSVGATDAAGRLTLEERRQPGEEVPVVVQAPKGAPWKGSFVVRRAESGQDTVTLEARLAAQDDRSAEARPRPEGPAVPGFPGRAAAPEERPAPESPRRAEAPAPSGPAEPKSKPMAVRALTEFYGTERPVPGVQILVGGRPAATTDAKGRAGVELPASGKPVRVTLVARDHVPGEWSAEIAPARRPKELRRFFYPVTPEPIRVGILPYAASAGAEPDVADGIGRLEESLSDSLFERKAFVEVADLKRKLDFAGLGVEEVTGRGWEKTPLRSQLDLLVVGSVAGSGPFTIETRVYTANGRLLLAHVKEAKDLKRPRDLTRDLAEEIVVRFPFEGTVLETLGGGRVRINLGRAGGREIESGTKFHLFVAETDADGRVTGRRDAGLGVVTRVEDLVAEVKPETDDGAGLSVGDRVVRALLDDPTVGATAVARLRVRAAGEDEAVSAANVYLDGAWVGATDREGEIELPIKPRRKYDLLVFKHGFEQARETVSFPQAGGERVVSIAAAAARFTLESAPSEAAVAVDGKEVGRTPITEPVQVRLGFRRVKVDAGGDYRPMDKVVEFARAEVSMTGPDRVVLEKDWLRIGERLIAEGKADEAMQTLAQAGPSHPDFSAARHRLGQLYLDERKDPDAAIREFENVLSRQENREVVAKRFAVVYTNLGHAYYAQGQAVARRDPEGAAKAYRKAIDALGVARQNSRFFPTATYDEALHDTYYYAALAHHRLADLTRSPEAFRRAEVAWQSYLDFFPKRLEGDPSYEKAREGAEQFYAEARRKSS